MSRRSRPPTPPSTEAKNSPGSRNPGPSPTPPNQPSITPSESSYSTTRSRLDRNRAANNNTFYIFLFFILGLGGFGFVGWFASYVYNNSVAENNSNSVQKEESKKEIEKPKPDENKEVTPAPESEKSKPETNRNPESSPAQPKVNLTRDTSSQKLIEPILPVSNPSAPVGPPKLSDLPSFKNEPPKKRFQLASKKRTTSPTTARDSKESANPDAAKSKKPVDEGPIEPNQYAIPQSQEAFVFFQDLTVDRKPSFQIATLPELKQEFKFQIASKFAIGDASPTGLRKVTQTIVATRLLSADPMSKKPIGESLEKLKGKQFTFSLDRRQRVIDFDGEKPKPSTMKVEDLTLDKLKGEGVLISSVMDFDGWREFAQLTFLLPDGKKKKWSDQMAHDWGELGQWTGETHFEKQPLRSRLLPIRYFHRMTYSPKKSPRLPFELDSVFFRAEEANGNLIYDPTNHRVHQLSEKFKINGELSASLLGTPVKMTMSEEQSFLLKITNQQPF